MTKKILLIESDGAFARQLSSALAARGLEARVSADGPDGLDQARTEHPDLIVLCVELPRMSGYAVCNRLKKDEQLRGIPLLITSAEATAETFEQHRKLKTHADDYLLKPFDAAALLQRMASLIELPPPPPDGSGEAVPLADLELDAIGAEVVETAPAPASRGGPAIDDEDLRLLDQVFDELAASGSEPSPPGEMPAPAPNPPRPPPLSRIDSGAPAAESSPGAARAGEVDALRARVAELTAELARAREELQASTAARAQDGARHEQELREAERRAEESARAAAERVRSAEERSATADARALAAEQRLRRDEAIREKTRKALALALQLLEDPGLRAASGEVLPRRE